MTQDTSRFDTFTRQDRYWIGVDPGRQQDPTAIAIVRVVKTDDGHRIFQCGYLHRMPLRTPYPVAIEHVDDLMQRPLYLDKCEVVLDLTGVGRPIRDMMLEADIRPLVSVNITAGFEITQIEGEENVWSVPKSELINRLLVLFEDGSLQIQQDLPETQALVAELQDFQGNLTDSGRWRFGAREGAHDDLLLALALAVWRAYARTSGVTRVYEQIARRMYGDDDRRPPLPPEALEAPEGQVLICVLRRFFDEQLGHHLERGWHHVAADDGVRLVAAGRAEML